MDIRQGSQTKRFKQALLYPQNNRQSHRINNNNKSPPPLITSMGQQNYSSRTSSSLISPQRQHFEKIRKIVPQLVLENEDLKAKVSLLTDNYEELKKMYADISQKVKRVQIEIESNHSESSLTNFIDGDSIYPRIRYYPKKRIENKASQNKSHRNQNQKQGQFLNPITLKNMKARNRNKSLMRSVTDKQMSLLQRKLTPKVNTKSMRKLLDGEKERRNSVKKAKDDWDRKSMDSSVSQKDQSGMLSYCKSEIMQVQTLNAKFKSKIAQQTNKIANLEKKVKSVEKQNKKLKQQLEDEQQKSKMKLKEVRAKVQQLQQKLLSQTLVFDDHRQLLEERVSSLKQEVKRKTLESNSEKQMKIEELIQQNAQLMAQNQEYCRHLQAIQTVEHLWKVKQIEFGNLIKLLGREKEQIDQL